VLPAVLTCKMSLSATNAAAGGSRMGKGAEENAVETLRMVRNILKLVLQTPTSKAALMSIVFEPTPDPHHPSQLLMPIQAVVTINSGNVTMLGTFAGGRVVALTRINPSQLLMLSHHSVVTINSGNVTMLGTFAGGRVVALTRMISLLKKSLRRMSSQGTTMTPHMSVMALKVAQLEVGTSELVNAMVVSRVLTEMNKPNSRTQDDAEEIIGQT